jgi:hypothetical protein
MWPRLATVGIGVWLTCAPSILGYGEPARTIDHVVGPLLAGVSFVAIWEVTRALRWAGVPIAALLLLAPVAPGYDATAAINSVAAGASSLLLALLRGPLYGRYGGGWRELWRADDGSG